MSGTVLGGSLDGGTHCQAETRASETFLGPLVLLKLLSVVILTFSVGS